VDGGGAGGIGEDMYIWGTRVSVAAVATAARRFLTSEAFDNPEWLAAAASNFHPLHRPYVSGSAGNCGFVWTWMFFNTIEWKQEMQARPSDHRHFLAPPSTHGMLFRGRAAKAKS
jgi:hypothetical protein